MNVLLAASEEHTGPNRATPSGLSESESLWTRAWRFARALIVGGGATLTDFSVFTLCVRAIGINAASARLPALLAGASVQFFGSRHFAFRAATGNLPRQARLFVVFEVVSVALNWALFQFLLPRLSVLPPELVTMVASSTIFVLYNYPTRRLIIFKLAEPAVQAPERARDQ
jgi:putative flippase GtrA